MSSKHDLDAVGYKLTGSERIAHSLVVHGKSVAHAYGAELKGNTANADESGTLPRFQALKILRINLAENGFDNAAFSRFSQHRRADNARIVAETAYTDLGILGAVL